MTLHVYDLDKTLINGDSNELWHEYLQELGILDDEFIKEDKRLMDLYAQGKLDMDMYLEFAVSAFKLIDKQKIESLMDKFLTSKIKPIVHKEAEKIIKNAKHKLIISATPEFIVRPISHMLGIDECIGMRLVMENGKFTGKYEKPLSYKGGKVDCLKIWLKEKDLHPEKITFYSDSINDLPLLEFADFAYCVNPDSQLENIAKKRDWVIYNW